MNVSSHTDPSTNSIKVIIDIANHEFDTTDPKSLIRKALAESVKSLADTYVEDNKTAILEKISPMAVANLAIADSAKLVREQFIDPKTKKDDK